jgi:hypothetical protein
VRAEGRHRYYTLAGANVAEVLEALRVMAGGARGRFVPSTPDQLRTARSCYDHLAGTLGVRLYDRWLALGLLREHDAGRGASCELTSRGEAALAALGVDVARARASRRRFVSACLDWSERRAHVGGAVGAAFLASALRRRWFTRVRDSRALELTALGARELRSRYGVREGPD